MGGEGGFEEEVGTFPPFEVPQFKNASFIGVVEIDDFHSNDIPDDERFEEIVEEEEVSDKVDVARRTTKRKWNQNPSICPKLPPTLEGAVLEDGSLKKEETLTCGPQTKLEPESPERLKSDDDITETLSNLTSVPKVSSIHESQTAGHKGQMNTNEGQTNANEGRMTTNEGRTTCPVCGGPAPSTFRFYGGRGCFGCREFFKRAARAEAKGERSVSRCVRGGGSDAGKCVIVPQGSRRNCRACRCVASSTQSRLFYSLQLSSHFQI